MEKLRLALMFNIIRQMTLLDKPNITIANGCSALFPATAGPFLFSLTLIISTTNGE